MKRKNKLHISKKNKTLTREIKSLREDINMMAAFTKEEFDFVEKNMKNKQFDDLIRTLDVCISLVSGAIYRFRTNK